MCLRISLRVWIALLFQSLHCQPTSRRVKSSPHFRSLGGGYGIPEELHECATSKEGAQRGHHGLAVRIPTECPSSLPQVLNYDQSPSALERNCNKWMPTNRSIGLCLKHFFESVYWLQHASRHAEQYVRWLSSGQQYGNMLTHSSNRWSSQLVWFADGTQSPCSFSERSRLPGQDRTVGSTE